MNTLYGFSEHPTSSNLVKNIPTLISQIDIHTTINIVCISSIKDFKNLKNDWNKLVAESINPHPFILWEWMFTWWETYQGKDDLRILALYQSGELIALAPFYLKSKGLFIKRLSLLGEGENEDDIIVTTYPDIIVKKTFRDESIQALSNYINVNKDFSSQFQYASFNLVHENSVLQEVGEHLSSTYINHIKHSENQFVIRLPKTEEDYDASLSKSTKKQFRLKLNRMKKAGDVELSSADSLTDGLATVEKLHRARWASTTDRNAFDSDKFLRFHHALCNRFQNQNIMDIRVMKHSDTPVAAAYNFNYQNSCYSYLSGFHSADDKRYSPMFLFDMLEIKNLIHQRYHCYDMLVSESENNYKTKFGSEVNSVYRIHWFRKGLIATTMLSYIKIKPTLSKVYHFFLRKS